MSRSSRSQMFLNTGVLEIFTTFNFIKRIQFYYTNLSKKRFQHRYFPVNIANFLRTPFSQNTSRTPASICLSQTIRKSFISIFYAEKKLSWRDAIYNRYAITFAGAQPVFFGVCVCVGGEETGSKNLVFLQCQVEKVIW